NPSLDAAEYVRSLEHLDPTTRAQLLAGDWDAFQGGRFRREWLQARWQRHGDGYRLDEGKRWVADGELQVFFTVDVAASVKEAADYTVISVWALTRRHE